MCVRISRDSYPNLHALHNASNDSLTDAAYVKISEGDFGYVLDDVPHLPDYLPTYPNPLQDQPAYSTSSNILSMKMTPYHKRLLFKRIAAGGSLPSCWTPSEG
ncbi:uncharacterized protein LOC119318434 [Triticum dicoccoides]|uniref:uncharacterized protein LOC119318434 n=1 Tax=Triticum dicoccoides TaxID=85692 RepID=UPI0018914B96|nr:uncharacterized protein LOC119318434 [Triticum dicoccoides]